MYQNVVANDVYVRTFNSGLYDCLYDLDKDINNFLHMLPEDYTLLEIKVMSQNTVMVVYRI